jgi:hypothetical protein
MQDSTWQVTKPESSRQRSGKGYVLLLASRVYVDRTLSSTSLALLETVSTRSVTRDL